MGWFRGPRTVSGVAPPQDDHADPETCLRGDRPDERRRADLVHPATTWMCRHDSRRRARRGSKATRRKGGRPTALACVVLLRMVSKTTHRVEHVKRQPKSPRPAPSHWQCLDTPRRDLEPSAELFESGGGAWYRRAHVKYFGEPQRFADDQETSIPFAARQWRTALRSSRAARMASSRAS